MTPINFIGSSYQSRSENYSSQRAINLYLEPGQGKAPGLLIGTPGLTAPYLTLSGGGVRGIYQATESLAIIVVGTKVYKLDTLGATTEIAEVGDDGLPVTIAGNGNDVLICSYNVLHAVHPNGHPSSVLMTGISAVDYLDGYFVFTEPSTGKFYVTARNATGIDLNDFESKTIAPDALVTLLVSGGGIYLFGTRSVERWYNIGSTGTTTFPFGRVDGGFYEIGCIAKNSVAKLDTPIWLGGDDKGVGSVWLMTGGQPKRISTPAIEYAIGQWREMFDAEAFTYTQEGHSFYVLSSQSGNQTWVYDISTNEWHQRAWLDLGGDLDRIRPRCHFYFNGRHLVGDWQNGNVYEYDLDTYSDNGNPLPRIRATQTLQNGFKYMRNSSFRLDMDTGVGLAYGQGSEPQAMLRWSKDGGKRWSNQIWRTFGKIGEYSRRCTWNRVGGGERTIYEVVITDPVKVQITGAYIG